MANGTGLRGRWHWLRSSTADSPPCWRVAQEQEARSLPARAEAQRVPSSWAQEAVQWGWRVLWSWHDWLNVCLSERVSCIQSGLSPCSWAQCHPSPVGWSLPRGPSEPVQASESCTQEEILSGNLQYKADKKNIMLSDCREAQQCGLGACQTNTYLDTNKVNLKLLWEINTWYICWLYSCFH